MLNQIVNVAGPRIVQIQYKPGPTDSEGWAGIYWLEPKDNWGTYPNGGFDLSGFTRLRFQARSPTPGLEVKFFVGGVSSGAYPSSISEPIPVGWTGTETCTSGTSTMKRAALKQR